MIVPETVPAVQILIPNDGKLDKKVNFTLGVLLNV